MQTASTTPTETAATASARGWARIMPRCTHAGEGVVEGDVGPADRGGAGAPVGLQHVAVHGDLHLAQGHQVAYRPQRPADQALDLLGATGLLPWAASRPTRSDESTRAAASTRRSPSPCRCPASREGPAPRPTPCTAPWSDRIDTRTEPGANSVKSRSKLTGRSWSTARPSARSVRGSTAPSLTARTPGRARRRRLCRRTPDALRRARRRRGSSPTGA